MATRSPVDAARTRAAYSDLAASGPDPPVPAWLVTTDTSGRLYECRLPGRPPHMQRCRSCDVGDKTGAGLAPLSPNCVSVHPSADDPLCQSNGTGVHSLA